MKLILCLSAFFLSLYFDAKVHLRNEHIPSPYMVISDLPRLSIVNGRTKHKWHFPSDAQKTPIAFLLSPDSYDVTWLECWERRGGGKKLANLFLQICRVLLITIVEVCQPENAYNIYVMSTTTIWYCVVSISFNVFINLLKCCSICLTVLIQ